MRSCGFVLAALVAFVGGLLCSSARADETNVAVEVEFFDSATGYSLHPDVVAHPHRQGGVEHRFGALRPNANGRAAIQLERGTHTITASLSTHAPVSGDLNVREHFPYRIRFLLDPVEKPRELQVENITARHRDDATLVQGFVVSDDTGEPLRAVRVTSTPSGVETRTDERGFYELYIPLQSPAHLLVEKPTYRTEERQYLELSPRGDWTYNFRLQRGTGTHAVDERSELRRQIEQDPPEETTATSRVAPMTQAVITPKSTLPSNATIRVPRNIRVQDSTNIYYVSMDFYEKHTLPHEWIASWGDNSLRAGAIPVRCYAIARINARGPDTDYDICGNSDCQNFKATSSSTSTDNAVDYTAGYVVVNSNGNIPSTEYSAENNSLDKPCGDGFAAPTSGCLYDPICAGHDRSGHGRGMCQRGSNRWGTGALGYPVRDWIWIINHYYSDLTLVKGAPLIVGDDVKSSSSDCSVRACSGGTIDNGTLCPLITSKAAGQTGVIIGGPLVITNDTKGFTWYQVRWNDANSTTGWSCENYLQRIVSTPVTPIGLVATAAGSTQVNLNYNDSSTTEAGYYIERAPSSVGPWLEIATLAANTTAYSDKNLYPGSTWFYRVRSYNSAGTSSYSAVASATTPNNVGPVLNSIPNRAVTPGTLVTFTNTATAPENVKLITDFEAIQSETGNGIVLFDTPNASTSTSNFLNGVPEMDIAAVTDTHPAGGQAARNVLMVKCQFTNVNNAWLRLSTAATTFFPDPVIDLKRKLRFDMYSDRAVQVAVGCRETTTAPGTAIGSDGGTSGAIEWAGVTGVTGTAPIPTRTIPSNTWTTVTFDFTNEPIRNFSGGNGVLSTTSGLGVLEHLAIVPKGGVNIYTFYIDNVAVVSPRAFTYTFAPGAPTNATLNATTGVFSWLPTAAQSPSTNQISVIATDDSVPPLSATNTFVVIVNQSVQNYPPQIAPIDDRTVYAGNTLVITNSAYDPNPGDTLTYSLVAGAPASAAINPSTGVFSWTTASADTNSLHPITIRVSDNATPPMSSTTSFSVTVLPPPPANRSPQLLPIDNCSINAGATLTFTNVAYDPDTNDILAFSLDSGAPSGAAIDPVTGIFAWTPPDSASNTTSSVTVRVTDNGQPPKSASSTFSITVMPRVPNQPPSLSPVTNVTVHAGTTVTFTNYASDPDPEDFLAFSLSGAPETAQIDIVTGVFTWTPADADANTTNHITIQVTDDGEPPLTASAPFDVIVEPRPTFVNVTVSATSTELFWSSITGNTYGIFYKNSLSDPTWQPLGSVVATNSLSAISDSSFSATPQRFYQIEVQ
jgi:hypothetical protein